MGTKSREVIFGGQVRAAKMKTERARKLAIEAARAADRADAHAWSLRIEGFGGPAQPSPTIAQCLNGGYGWLEVKCRRCETRASPPLDAIRRPPDTPIWKLESALPSTWAMLLLGFTGIGFVTYRRSSIVAG